MKRVAVLAVCAACGGGGGSAIDAGLVLFDASPDAFGPDAGYVPTDAAPGDYPDFLPVATLMDGTAYIEFPYEVSPNDPVLVEGCVGGPGTRRLLRFDTVTANAGASDFYVGPPSDDNPLFVYSPAHEHYHLRDYADYTLIAADQTTVAGHKQAFCLLDSTQLDPEAVAHYDCDNQGISVGYADTYGAYLDCQWIDVTGLPSGEYTLRVEINGNQLFPETSYDNNVYETLVNL